MKSYKFPIQVMAPVVSQPYFSQQHSSNRVWCHCTGPRTDVVFLAWSSNAVQVESLETAVSFLQAIFLGHFLPTSHDMYVTHGGAVIKRYGLVTIYSDWRERYC